MDIVRLASGEWERLRAIRLATLRDSPDAFASTYDDYVDRTEDVWRGQLAALTTFVAHDSGVDVGMVRTSADEDDPHRAFLISMWVAPQVRGAGIGGALVDAVIAWVRASGATTLVLEVTDDNYAAIALYARKGFVPTGVRATLPPPREHIGEHERELRLNAEK